MTANKWILVDFATCPICGDDAEILTNSKEQNQFFDDDEVRCCQSHKCTATGFIAVEDGVAEVNWHHHEQN